ncbi:MAG: potassium/proton antiporter [Vicinamibacterales bacterium]|nr:potassium/proton antiporter [Vicinamibacterales bacterium]
MSPLILPVVFVSAVLLLASVLASKAARVGIPALLLFLAVGMLAGSDGPGGIHFDNPSIAQGMGVVALAFILFGGGLTTRWEDVRPVAARGAALATIGVLITAGLTGLFAWQVAGLPLAQGLLLGAIVSSTDAAAVFGVLRTRSIGLAPRLRSLLEFESGSNDPMAVFLTISLVTWIVDPSPSLGRFALQFPWQMAMGAAVGFGMGVLLSLAVNHAWLEYDGLYPVLTIGLVLLTYAAAEIVGGNAFLAVYVAGIAMRRRDFLHKRSLLRFHDGLAWLMQILMFLTLGLQVYPSKLPAVAGVGLAVALFLMFVARPAATVLTLLPARVSWREQALIAWVGLRGAAPIILATFPLVGGVAGAELIFELVFFIVLMSALVQGTSLPWVARRLGLATGGAATDVDPIDLVATAERDLVQVLVRDGSPAAGRRLMDLHLPKGSLVVVVERGGLSLVPSGSTQLQSGDRLVVLAAHQDGAAVKALGSG